MNNDYGLTCIHQPAGVDGLCLSCLESLEYDPSAYIEFGDHPQGLKNWRAELELIAKDAESTYHGGVDETCEEIPF